MKKTPILMGIGDEAGAPIGDQISAIQELGWKNVEMRSVQVGVFPKGNIHEIYSSAFDIVADQLQSAGINVHCFGSAIMNWQKTIKTPFAVTQQEVTDAIERMRRLGTKFVRIMSYKPGGEESITPPIVFEHVREVTQRFLDAGIQPVHENCMNYGGMSFEHTLKLLGQCPGLKLVFDTANPVFNPDRRRKAPWPRQDAWEFWESVRDHVVHIHVKDAIWDEVKGKETYTWPGEGSGHVRKILKDALSRGYDGGISIEPHMVAVFHDAQAEAASPNAARENFVEYGRRLERLITEVSAEAT